MVKTRSILYNIKYEPILCQVELIKHLIFSSMSVFFSRLVVRGGTDQFGLTATVCSLR